MNFMGRSNEFKLFCMDDNEYLKLNDNVINAYKMCH